MDSLIGMLMVGGVLWWAYTNGKRTGSRKGYQAGLNRGRRRAQGRRR